MSIHRRALLGAAGAAIAAPALAQTVPAAPSLTDRITEAARANSSQLAFDAATFSGPAFDLLVAEGKRAQFFQLGEEHGIAENAKLAAQLFEALTPEGYSKACVEISPPMAHDLDRALGEAGLGGLRGLLAQPEASVAFINMREEAEWLARARAAVGRPCLWGLDYEVGADRRLIALLKAKRKPAAAEAALAALEQASSASWARYAETRNPQFIYSFAGDPELAAALRTAWPRADAESAWIIDTLEETFAINRHWTNNEGGLSNQRRARFMRANLLRYLAAERELPRVLFKFGGNHMVRGLTETYVHDVGTMIAELAEARGRTSFRMLVLPGAGGQIAAFDASAWTSRPRPADLADYGVDALMAAAAPAGFTLIDLRPVRAIASGRAADGLGANLLRTIHGYDALLVLAGCTASANL